MKYKIETIDKVRKEIVFTQETNHIGPEVERLLRSYGYVTLSDYDNRCEVRISRLENNKSG